MLFIEKNLTDKYYEILEKHGNRQWAYEELDYLVYDAYKGKYEEISQADKKIVDKCMDKLKEVSYNK